MTRHIASKFSAEPEGIRRQGKCVPTVPIKMVSRCGFPLFYYVVDFAMRKKKIPAECKPTTRGSVDDLYIYIVCRKNKIHGMEANTPWTRLRFYISFSTFFRP